MQTSKLLALVAVVAGILGVSNPSSATELIVPSYFYPGTGGPGGSGDGWAAMATAAAQVPLVAVLNPNSGPASGPADPNYVSAMTNLEAAGGKVVAYVYTNNGSTPVSTVESQITEYLSQYGSLIDGFYLDGMFIDSGTLSYYQTLDSYIKGLSGSYQVIGNPGQPFLNGVTPSDYLSTADVFDIFEGPNTANPGDPQFTQYPYGLNWFENYPAGRFDNTVFSVPEGSLLADLSRAVSLNAGSVYITDQGSPSPYAQLPSYWNEEVSDLAALDSSVPEPSTLSLFSIAGIAAAIQVVKKWRAVRLHSRQTLES